MPAPLTGGRLGPMVLEGHLGGYIAGGDPATWYPALWDWMVRRLRVRSVLDLGCGEGHAARWFAHRGRRVLGVDGSCQAIAASVLPERVVRHDLCEGAFLAPEAYDAVWACEVVEHVEAVHLDALLTSLCQARRWLVMTHATPGQPGHHHVNCQEATYWVERVQARGFGLQEPLTRRARRHARRDSQPGYGNHFARSGLVFRRRARRPA